MAPDRVPDPQPRRSWLARLFRWGHGVCLHSWRGFLVLLCVVLYGWLIGLPGFLVNHGLRRLDTEGFRLVVDRVRLDPTSGLVAEGVFLYPREDYSEPMARVQRVVLQPDRSALRRFQLRLRALEVDKGALRLPPLVRSNQPPVRVAVREIRGRIVFHADRVELDPLYAHAFGINWRSTGAVLRLPTPRGSGVWKELKRAMDAVAKAPPATAEVAAELNALRFQPPPLARVGFRFDPAATNGWSVHVQAEGREAELRGARFDSVQAEILVQGYHLDLRNITLGSAGRRGQLTGQLDLASRLAEARLYSDLPPAPWIAVMPRRWQQELTSAGLSAAGSMKSEVWIGPAPLDELARCLRGWVALEKASVRNIPLERGYASVRVTGDTVYVENFSAVVGQAAGRGPMDGSLTWQRDTGELDGTLNLNFDPNLVLPILSSNQARLVRRFTFPARAPSFSGHFRRSRSAPARLSLEGLAQAAECTYRGVALTALVATIRFTNQVVSLKPWMFQRPEGTITGELHVALPDHLITLDLAGRMDPHAVAGLVGPGLQHALAPTRYEGPVFLHAQGTVDAGHHDQRTDLHLQVDGQRLGVSRWLADTARFDLYAQGGHYRTTNVTGTAYGGDFQASVFIRPEGSGLVYEVTALITNAEMARIAAQVRTNATFDQKGRLRALIRVTGPTPDPGFRQMTGSGSLQVEDGEIMRLPVFGGLSRLLSALYPGLGFASQDDLQADLTIQKGRVVTRNGRLEGTLISMKAAGYYAFDGRLRFNVEVQLLRKGPLASVLRLITLPVTKLLVFQLSGSVQDPQWRPANLPKELFLIFE